MGKQTHTQPHPRQTGGISKAGWKHPRHPDTAAGEPNAGGSVTQLSPALISSWLKLHQVLGILCCSMVLSCRAPHTAPLCFGDAPELCTWCPFKALAEGASCGRSGRRTPFPADQDTPPAAAWLCCECGRVWYQVAPSSAWLLELAWAQGDLPFSTQSRERGTGAQPCLPFTLQVTLGALVRWGASDSGQAGASCR